MITTDIMRGMIAEIARLIAENRAHLNTLDSELGDGDHGTTISTGFNSAVKAIQDATSPADVLSATAKTLMNRMGGSSGAIFGTLFLRAGMTVKGNDTVTPQQFAEMWGAGADGVKTRGKAGVGDKTMVDALVPAVNALKGALDSDDDLGSALESASQAATQGAESTAPLQAKYGRARYLGERAIGHVDAGAQSVAYMFSAMHTYWKENEHGET